MGDKLIWPFAWLIVVYMCFVVLATERSWDAARQYYRDSGI